MDTRHLQEFEDPMVTVPENVPVREAPWFVSYEEWLELRRVRNRRVVQKTSQQAKPITVIYMVILVGFFISLCSFSSDGIATAIGSCLFIFGILMAYLIGAMKNVTQSEKWDTFRDIDEVSTDIQSWYVELNILDGECIFGSDVGILWFEDSRLYFTGQRTSFALARDDVSDRGAFFRRRPKLIRGFHHEQNLLLEDKGMFGKRVVSLHYGPRCRDFAPLALTDFNAALDEFLWLRRRKGNGQLPPSDLGPGALTVERIWWSVALETMHRGIFSALLFVGSYAFLGFLSGGRISWVASLAAPLLYLIVELCTSKISRWLTAYRQLKLAQAARIEKPGPRGK